jgi:hypothetical protein
MTLLGAAGANGGKDAATCRYRPEHRFQQAAEIDAVDKRGKEKQTAWRAARAVRASDMG